MHGVGAPTPGAQYPRRPRTPAAHARKALRRARGCVRATRDRARSAPVVPRPLAPACVCRLAVSRGRLLLKGRAADERGGCVRSCPGEPGCQILRPSCRRLARRSPARFAAGSCQPGDTRLVTTHPMRSSSSCASHPSECRSARSRNSWRTCISSRPVMGAQRMWKSPAGTSQTACS